MAATSADARIAYFITPHGYGHAARAAAVMAALLRRQPGLRFDIFTQVPSWFFASTLDGAFDYHDLLTDVGLAQQTALSEDVPETLRRLADLLPFDLDLVMRLGNQLRQAGCRLVACDIAPLGIAVARAIGIPSVLVENFTWDYIYAGYLAEDRRLAQYIDYLADIFASADFRIQTAPVSHRVPGAATTAPVSRAARAPRSRIRRQLAVPDDAKLVLLTMGGFSWQYDFLDVLASRPQEFFIVPGSSHAGTAPHRAHPPNVVCLPHHSGFFHPDLVNASDAVVGKVGYSTVAEVFWSGGVFGYVPRPRFRESHALVEFVQSEMHGLPVSDAEFDSGEWITRLADLLALPRTVRAGLNGADQVAEFVSGLLAG
jgi:UDP:flavonoid glycosyltransferase YjiC (YdhE family)